MSCYNFMFLEYYSVYNYGGIKMVNNRGRNFLYKSYICSIGNSLDNMFEQLSNLDSTSGISADFINQFLIYQKLAEKTAKNTALCTNFKPVFDMSSEIAGKRCGMLSDINKMKTFCSNFKIVRRV